MLNSLVEITLPLVGVFTVPLIALPLSWAGLFLIGLFVAVTLDNRKEG